MPLYAMLMLLFLTAALVLFFILSSRQAAKKQLARISRAFGKAPSPGRKPPEDITSYYTERPSQQAFPEIDSRTWDDLDMDAVFQRLDACQTETGESLLYDQLHLLAKNPDLDKLLTYYQAAPGERLKAQVLLARFGNGPCKPLVALLFSDERQTLPMPWLYRVLACLPFLSLSLLFVSPAYGVVAVLGFFVLNILLHYLFSRRIQAALIGIGGVSRLLRLNKRLAALPGFPLAAEIATLLSCFRGFQTGMPMGKRQSSGDMDLLMEYANAALLRDLRTYNRIQKLLLQNRQALCRLYCLAGYADAAAAVLSFQKSLPFTCTPVFTPENSLHFQDLYHPLVQEPVCNTGDFSQSVLITGSNASGKSTFLKAIAVNAILGQSLGLCCARSFTLQPGLVVSSMAMRDSLTQGESYFIAEIKSLKRILDAVKQGYALCFIDEILRGTNSVERIAASAAVLAQLNHRSCLCLVASHDLELPGLLENTYESYHFSEQVTDKGVEFDYLLKPGISNTRNAILLLEQMGFGQSLVSDARSRAALLEQEKGL